MKKKVTNFVLHTLHKKILSIFRTNEEGRIIRKTRMKKFKPKGKKLVLAIQVVAVWYLLILSGTYLTSDTGAYFNDVETISGTISVADDFCQDVKNGSDFWHKYCKDNAGIGNGPDAPDVDTGEGTDPDNPGQNKDGCDDHTNAPCTRITNLKESHTGNSITLSWSNPNKDFDFVKVYRNGDDNLVGDNIKNGQFIDENLLTSTKYRYKIVIVDSSGKELPGISIDVTTSNDEVKNKLPENVVDLKGSRNGNSDNIDLSWKNPTGISHVRIYIEGKSIPIKDNFIGENIKLTSDTEVTYRVSTIDSTGNESKGETITVK
jgi:predicted ribosomally synthesized peptide with SipW-like signal peptide